MKRLKSILIGVLSLALFLPMVSNNNVYADSHSLTATNTYDDSLDKTWETDYFNSAGVTTATMSFTYRQHVGYGLSTSLKGRLEVVDTAGTVIAKTNDASFPHPGFTGSNWIVRGRKGTLTVNIPEEYQNQGKQVKLRLVSDGSRKYGSNENGGGYLIAYFEDVTNASYYRLLENPIFSSGNLTAKK